MTWPGRAPGVPDRGLERLVDRCLLVGFEETDPPDWLRRVAPDVGAVVLYGPNLRVDGDVGRLAGQLRSDADVLVTVDEEGGDVTRLYYRSGSRTPGNHVLGRADDPWLTTAVARRIGADLSAAGVLLDLAPDVDVNVDPDNPVIGVRSFGAAPDLVSRHATAWIHGLQSSGVAACAKHFPGHGDTRVDSHRDLPVIECDEREWRTLHVPPFAAAVEAGVRAVMTAHVQIPALDAAPATMSRRILLDLLRGELGFDGVIVTDALDMGALRRLGEPAAAVAALAAGADALCLGAVGGEGLYRRVRDAVVDAVRTGDLPAARVAEAAARVEQLRAWIATAVPAESPEHPEHPETSDTPAASGVAGSAGAAARTVDEGDPGLAAARRAVVAHRVPPLSARPVVVELRGEQNPAVGEAAWDLGRPLAELGFPPMRTLRLGAPGPGVAEVVAQGVAEGVAEVLVAAGEAPVVVVARDLPRHEWQRAVWDRMRAARPGAVLVDLGLQRPAELPDGAPYLLVGGAAQPNLRVAAEILRSGPVTDG